MEIKSLLQQTAHRTAPMPTAPWIMVQKWHDLLFAHWAVPVNKLRALVPRELELDLRDGKAYVAVAPFWMSGIRGRGMPPLPSVHTFPELNVRTYVTYQGIPGVYFFSLDAASRVAVKGARWFYGLPYFFANMSLKNSATVSVSSMPVPELIILSRPSCGPAIGRSLRHAYAKGNRWKPFSPTDTASTQWTERRYFARTYTICHGSCRTQKLNFR